MSREKHFEDLWFWKYKANTKDLVFMKQTTCMCNVFEDYSSMGFDELCSVQFCVKQCIADAQKYEIQ